MHDLSVIIVSWNVNAFLRRCLASIYRFTGGVNFEIFVADNHSTDGSIEMVKQEFPKVHIIENRSNIGYAAANNEALKLSTGRYILFLNPDTELVDDAFKKMTDFMDGRNDVDALGCRLIYPDGSLQRSCRHFPSIFTDLMDVFYLDHFFPSSRFFNRYRMGSWAHDDTRQVDHVYGACLLVRQETLERVGPLDENLFMYYDEIDLCYRIKRSGGRVFFTDTATIIHHANRSSSQAMDECEHYKAASRLHFFAKHYGVWSIYILTINLVVKTFMIWVVCGISRLIFRRPRNLDALKRQLSIMWSEQIDFFKKK